MPTPKPKRLLSDTYAFPGFRPEPTVRGVFGDPTARAIPLKQRSKNQSAAAVAGRTRVGTTASFEGYAICPAATPASI